MFNGVILDISDRREAEEVLQDRQEKMESLYTATSLLLTAGTPEAVAGRTYGVLQDVLDFPVGGVVLLENGTLQPGAGARGDESQLQPWLAVGEEEGIVARARESGETIVVEDREVSEEGDGGDTLRSVAAVPVGEHGAIVIGQEQEGEFDPFELRLIEVLATHVTVVLDRQTR